MTTATSPIPDPVAEAEKIIVTEIVAFYLKAAVVVVIEVGATVWAIRTITKFTRSRRNNT